MHIAGSHEFAKKHGYSIKRTGPMEYTVFDDESEPTRHVVCKGASPAEAFRALISERFT